MGDRRVCVPRNAESKIIGPVNVPGTQERADRSRAPVTKYGRGRKASITPDAKPTKPAAKSKPASADRPM